MLIKKNKVMLIIYVFSSSDSWYSNGGFDMSSGSKGDKSPDFLGSQQAIFSGRTHFMCKSDLRPLTDRITPFPGWMSERNVANMTVHGTKLID